MRILIVDDELTNRLVLQGILGALGECDIAVDGEDAMETFHLAWKEKKPYQLICLDIMMPKMDGKLVLKAVRDYEKEQGIPESQCAKILMISARSEQEVVMDAVQNGANWYLVKPISTQKVMAEISRLGLT